MESIAKCSVCGNIFSAIIKAFDTSIGEFVYYFPCENHISEIENMIADESDLKFVHIIDISNPDYTTQLQHIPGCGLISFVIDNPKPGT